MLRVAINMDQSCDPGSDDHLESTWFNLKSNGVMPGHSSIEDRRWATE